MTERPMTDRERAICLIHLVAAAPDGVAAIDEVVLQLQAARLEERAAIVAWIRGRYEADALAGRIERGEHA